MQFCLASPNWKPSSGVSFLSAEIPYQGLPGPPNLGPGCPLWSHIGSLPTLCPPSVRHPGILTVCLSLPGLGACYFLCLPLPNSFSSFTCQFSHHFLTGLSWSLWAAPSVNSQSALYFLHWATHPLPLPCSCFSQQSLPSISECWSSTLQWKHNACFMHNSAFSKRHILKSKKRTSLVAQWLRIRLPVQGTRVWALVWEDPTCRRATKPVRHNYWACTLEPACHNY